MHYLLLAIGVIFGIYGLYRFFLNADVKQITALFTTAGFIVICAALFFLAVTGRLPAALGLLAALWPLGIALWHRKKNPRQDAPPASTGPMTRTEALEVLGLEDGATTEEIKTAYKALIKKIHPDQKGSEWLAAKINQARDILIKKA